MNYRPPPILPFLVALCRVCMGFLVMKTGFDLIRGHTIFLFWGKDDTLGGVFLLLIGAYLIFFSVTSLLQAPEK